MNKKDKLAEAMKRGEVRHTEVLVNDTFDYPSEGLNHRL